jgi:4-hydroxy-2-oxoheptanedioate aldolase
VANAADIAGTQGIDVLMIGPADLSTELGIPGQWEHEKVRDAYRQVCAACRKHGISAGTGGVGGADWTARYIADGVHMILTGSDHRAIMEAGTQRAEFYRTQEARSVVEASKTKRAKGG